MDEDGALDEAVVALLDAAPAPVVATTPDGRVGYANLRALSTFGWSAEELLGRPVEVLVPPESVDGHARLRAAYADPDAPHRSTDARELVARRRDGSQFPAEIGLLPLRVGGATWVVATIRDLTTRAEVQQRLRESNRAYLTLARTNQAVVRATDEAALFRDVCRVVVVQGDYLGAWIGVPDDGRVRRVASAGALEDYFAALDIVLDPADPRGRGPTAVAVRDGRPYFSSDFMADVATTPWHDLAAPFGIAALATLPLRCRGEVVAALMIYSQRSHVFDDAMRDLLLNLGENLSSALDGFEQERRLVDLARQRSELAERLMVAQEEERGRIAADLHDESVQALAALDLRLALLAKRARRAGDGAGDGAAGDAGLAADLEKVRTGVVTVSQQLRDLLFELEAPTPGQTPLEMVREVAAHALEGAGVRWDVEVDDALPLPSLGTAVRGQVLRILKESLLNVRHHARATRVTVRLTPTGSGLGVVVRDDGVGFDPATPAVRGHRGLKNLVDRADVAGGWLRVEPGDPGTVVRLWVPAGTDG